MIAEEIKTPVSLERNKKQTFILLAEIFTERIKRLLFKKFIFL